jgi:hypothetical protein
MIRFNCPRCRLLMQTAESTAGQLVACAKCSEQMRVPSLPGPAPAAPASPPIHENPFQGLGGDVGPEVVASETEATFADMTRSTREEEETARLEALWRELPQPLPEKVQRLGQPRVIYKSEGKGSLLIKTLFGAAGIGLVFLAAAFKGVRSEQIARGLLILSGVAFAFAAVIITVIVLFGGSFRLIFFDEAMVLHEGRYFTVYRLQDVEQVRHNSTAR